MAVDPDGGQVGTLGGGCVENEVKQNAVRQLGHDGVRLQSYILDHDYAWADGLICGGKMVIATESLKGAGALDYYRRLHQAIESGEGFTEAVVVDPERIDGASLGGRFLFDHDGRPTASRPGSTFPEALGERLAALVDRPRARVDRGVAWLPVLPRIRLVVIGAGHVGQAVANLAADADFDVWVVDDRGQYASRERFPNARKFIVGPIEEVLKGLEVTRNTFVLIVTRGHGHDQEALFHMAPTPAPYVGLIGSKRKIRLIFESLREMGIADADLARVTAPVGLDIGSRTVPEIAVSIVAELIARRNLGPKVATPESSACTT
jgi:xanthine dehydrogenase accessory factor